MWKRKINLAWAKNISSPVISDQLLWFSNLIFIKVENFGKGEKKTNYSHLAVAASLNHPKILVCLSSGLTATETTSPHLCWNWGTVFFFEYFSLTDNRANTYPLFVWRWKGNNRGRIWTSHFKSSPSFISCHFSWEQQHYFHLQLHPAWAAAV